MEKDYLVIIQERVLNAVRRNFKDGNKISLETTFSQLGFDSLDFLELLNETEKEFEYQIPIKEDFFYEERCSKLTVKDLADYVHSEFRHSFGRNITTL